MTMPSLPPYQLPPVPTVPGMPGYLDPQSIAALAGPAGIIPSDPGVAPLIQSIQQQAAAEGATAQETLSRVTTLFDQYKGLYQHGVLDVGQAMKAARSFVANNHEISGAIDQVSSLVSAAESAINGSGTPIDKAAAFAGPMITFLVGASVMSAGLGAAIVAGIAIVDQITDKLIAFPGSQQLTPSQKYHGDKHVNYVISGDPYWGVGVSDPLTSITPNSIDWRKFPEINNPDDAWWYADASHNEEHTWPKGSNAATWVLGDNGNDVLSFPMPIAQAFPELVFPSPARQGKGIWIFLDTATFTKWKDWYQYSTAITADDAKNNTGPDGQPLDENRFSMGAYLDLPRGWNSEQLIAFQNFTIGFGQAWKVNKEYWLNGRIGVTDAQVLEQFVTMWNRAHLPGIGAEISQQQGDNPWGFYWISLIGDLVANSTDPNIVDGHSIKINTGPSRFASLIAGANAASNAPTVGYLVPGGATIAQLVQGAAKAKITQEVLQYKASQQIAQYMAKPSTQIAKFLAEPQVKDTGIVVGVGAALLTTIKLALFFRR